MYGPAAYRAPDPDSTPANTSASPKTGTTARVLEPAMMYSTLTCGRPPHAYVTTFLTTDAACGRWITTSAATLSVGSEHSSPVRQLLFMARTPPKESSDPSDAGQLNHGNQRNSGKD